MSRGPSVSRNVTSYTTSGTIRHPRRGSDTVALIQGPGRKDMILLPPRAGRGGITGSALVIIGRRCIVRLPACRGAHDEVRFGNQSTKAIFVAFRGHWVLTPQDWPQLALTENDE